MGARDGRVGRDGEDDARRTRAAACGRAQTSGLAGVQRAQRRYWPATGCGGVVMGRAAEDVGKRISLPTPACSRAERGSRCNPSCTRSGFRRGFTLDQLLLCIAIQVQSRFLLLPPPLPNVKTSEATSRRTRDSITVHRKPHLALPPPPPRPLILLCQRNKSTGPPLNSWWRAQRVKLAAARSRCRMVVRLSSKVGAALGEREPAPQRQSTAPTRLTAFFDGLQMRRLLKHGGRCFARDLRLDRIRSPRRGCRLRQRTFTLSTLRPCIPFPLDPPSLGDGEMDNPIVARNAAIDSLRSREPQLPDG